MAKNVKKRVGLEFRVDNKAAAGFATVGRDMRRIESQMRSIGRLAVGFLGFHQIARGIRSITEAAMAQEQAEHRLAAALANTGDASQRTVRQLQQFAAQLQRLTIYGDEQTLEQMAYAKNLGVTTEQLRAATVAAMGLAAKYKLDLQTAMMLVGRASQGQTQMLTRYGIVLDENLSAQEKFNAILRLGVEAFELAEAEAETTAGSLKQLGAAWGDVKENIGEASGAMTGLHQVYDDLTKYLQQGHIESFVEQVAQGLLAIRDAIDAVGKALDKLPKAQHLGWSENAKAVSEMLDAAGIDKLTQRLSPSRLQSISEAMASRYPELEIPQPAKIREQYGPIISFQDANYQQVEYYIKLVNSYMREQLGQSGSLTAQQRTQMQASVERAQAGAKGPVQQALDELAQELPAFDTRFGEAELSKEMQQWMTKAAEAQRRQIDQVERLRRRIDTEMSIIGRLSESPYRAEQYVAFEEAARQAYGPGSDKYNKAMAEYGEALEKLRIAETVNSAMVSLADTLAQIPFDIENADQALMSFFQNLAQQLMRELIFAPATNALGGAIMGALGAGASAGVSAASGGFTTAQVNAATTQLATMPAFHGGGVVGFTPTAQRAVPADLFFGAPRFHGGLLPGEVPAILERGETVLPKGVSLAPSVRLEIRNETGIPVAGKIGDMSFDGHEYVAQVILDHLAQGTPLRDALRGGR